MLDLKSRDGMLRVCHDIVEHLGLEVADADTAGYAVVHELLHAFPCLPNGNLSGLDGAFVVHPPGLCFGAVSTMARFEEMSSRGSES